MTIELFNLITPGTTLLTPNQRLSAALLSRYNQLQVQQKKSSWESLDILPLSSWLKRLWDDCSAKKITANPFLLSKDQEAILWEIQLRKFPESQFLLQVAATAELAMSAWELLKLWQVDLDHPSLTLTEDGKAFQQWAKQFQKMCRQNNWIDRNSLVNQIEKHLHEKTIEPPKHLILTGFTEISPLHESFFKECEKLGTNITYYNSTHRAHSVKKISLINEEDEIRTMARWAKAIYDAHSDKPTYLIGCVIPRLETMRNKVMQIFSEAFRENNTFTLDHSLSPFNISAGRSLLSFPIVHTAFELLKLHQPTISIETISSILRSPFLGGAELEQIKRANFEIRLRTANITTLSLGDLIRQKPSYNLSSSCPLLAKYLNNYYQELSHYKINLTASEQINNVMRILKIMGWPGERSLSSQEYQVTQRFLELLTEFATFDTILPPLPFSKTIDYLIGLSAKTIFQFKTKDAPIQILGMLEATELPFQYLWVMGLDDQNWPAAPKPNPLIPQRLQKSLQMPHATSEREYIYCEKLLQQLRQSASDIVLSYPQKNEDIDLRPSSLIKDIAEISAADINLSSYSSTAEKIFVKRELQFLEDNKAPPVGENEPIRASTSLFKLQAACPFKAFAELRLHARRLEIPTLGLRAIDRGNVVHKALELIWSTIKDSKTLAALSQTNLEELIRDCVKQALKLILMTTDEDALPNQRYLSLEQQRLEKIIYDWLMIENDRPEFKVKFQEYETKTMIGNIPITVRIDRIDELADGSYVIIDYKTGKNNDIKNWFGPRTDEPQLPLYCIISDKKTIGIAFGQVHPVDMGLIGVSKNNINIKSIKTLPEISYAEAELWDEQLNTWRSTLENLSHDFISGIADVDPKDTNLCNQCKLQTFCRVHEK